MEKLERENARLQRELTQARLIIDVQKKVSALLGIPMATETKDEE
jgi:transposase